MAFKIQLTQFAVVVIILKLITGIILMKDQLR